MSDSGRSGADAPSGHSASPEPGVSALLLAEKDRLDRVSLEQCFTNDPVERMIGESLTAAGFKWKHEGHPDRRNDPITLDFEIADGPYIEVKRFHTPRCETQLNQVENVILVQGIGAARWFADLIMAARIEAGAAETAQQDSARRARAGNSRPQSEGQGD